MDSLNKLSFLWMCVVLFISFPTSLLGEEKNPAGPYERDPLFLNKMDIKGSVLNPKISNAIPWKSPESVEEGGEVTLRGHLQNLLIPLEPEDFGWGETFLLEGTESGLLENGGHSVAGEE